MIPNLDVTPYSESLRRVLYDTVARIVFTPDSDEPALIVRPTAGELAVFYAWGRWFAVWRDLSEDALGLPPARVWQVVRLSADSSTPDGIMMHEV
jgi:hypothetical protein